nr:MAG: hypothetical protein OI862_00130 [Candidatus Methanoperedens sp.]
MIRKCTASDFERIYEIVNNGAQVYKGVIPSAYWTEPYMSREDLKRELHSFHKQHLEKGSCPEKPSRSGPAVGLESS